MGKNENKRNGSYKTAGLIAAVLLMCLGGSQVVNNTQTQPQTTKEEVVQSDAVTDEAAQNFSALEGNADTAVQEETAVNNDAIKEDLKFRNEKLLNQHYEKHGIEMGFASAEEYEAAAALVPADSSALHKIEAEDGDDVYYIESSNEFVVVSTDGYIRTYFKPDSGKRYFDRQ